MSNSPRRWQILHSPIKIGESYVVDEDGKIVAIHDLIERTPLTEAAPKLLGFVRRIIDEAWDVTTDTYENAQSLIAEAEGKS